MKCGIISISASGRRYLSSRMHRTQWCLLIRGYAVQAGLKPAPTEKNIYWKIVILWQKKYSILLDMKRKDLSVNTEPFHLYIC